MDISPRVAASDNYCQYLSWYLDQLSPRRELVASSGSMSNSFNTITTKYLPGGNTREKLIYKHKSTTISHQAGYTGGNDTRTGRQVLQPTNHVAPLITTSGKLTSALTNQKPGRKWTSSRDSVSFHAQLSIY